MARDRLHPADARAYWMASTIPSDQFLLYCFDAATTPLPAVCNHLLERAATIPELRLRIRDVPLDLDYPYWIDSAPGAESILVHERPRDWSGCLETLAASFADQLDPRRRVWRLHLFTEVREASPTGSAPATVAVLQLSHAAADGGRASRIARDLFGPRHEEPPMPRRPGASAASNTAHTLLSATDLPFDVARMVRRGLRASADATALREATEAGRVPVQPPGQARTALDVAPTGRTSIRTITLPAEEVRRSGSTVTVTALTAISVALQRFLSTRSPLAAEVTVGRAEREHSRNSFGNVGVDLHTDIADISVRARAIGHALDRARRRSEHPMVITARRSQDAAEAVVPAFLAHWGVRRFDASTPPTTVIGNTVVSSVRRGAADLALGGGRVRFTAGFPALSPAMSLTHGVHGLGDTVTIGITSNSAAVPDPDAYAELLRESLSTVAGG